MKMYYEYEKERNSVDIHMYKTLPFKPSSEKHLYCPEDGIEIYIYIYIYI